MARVTAPVIGQDTFSSATSPTLPVGPCVCVTSALNWYCGLVDEFAAFTGFAVMAIDVPSAANSVASTELDP